ncbi:MAG: response regulator [Chloroflexota bacterium]|nr:response regulator [Chloroflexota bacterium]
MSNTKPHVAVVNDDTVFLRLLEELLRTEEGYEVSTCFVGSEGYSFVRQAQPDLVILDLVFGNGAEEGWRTLDLLTPDPVTRRIPVIVCSAANQQLHQHEDWLRRFDVRVLPKPFDLDVLLRKVHDALGDPREGESINLVAAEGGRSNGHK